MQNKWTRRAVEILKTMDRPLFAPTEEILDIYQQSIAHAKEHKLGQITVLILGMTPELADLALLNECLVFRVDHNPKRIENAKARQKVTNQLRDIVIQGDWLDMHMIEDGRIDLILGDASLNNIPHAQVPKMLDELLRVTHSGSRFMFKQFVIPDETINNHEFESIISLFRGGEMDVFDLFRILHFYSFISDAYDPTTRELHAPKVFDAIERKHSEGALTDEEFKLLKSKKWNIVHTVYKCAEQKNILQRLGHCSILLPGNRPMYRHMHMFSIDRR